MISYTKAKSALVLATLRRLISRNSRWGYIRLVLHLQGKFHAEDGSAFRPILCPDAAFVSRHDLAAHRQPQAYVLAVSGKEYVWLG